MRFRTIYRYTAAEVLAPFFLALFVLTFVLIMFQILKVTEMVVNYGVEIGDVLRTMFYILPPFFVFTIPMSLLLAVILTIGRLSSDSELTAMKASGVGLHQLLPPILIISAVAYAATAWLSLHGDPWGKQQLKRMLYDVGQKNATLGLLPQAFNDQFANLVVYVDRIDTKTQELSGIFISDERNPELPNVIIAKSGMLMPAEKDLKLVINLENGAIHRTIADARIYEQAHFDRYKVVVDLAKAMDGDSYQKTYLEMAPKELTAYIAGLRKDPKRDNFMMRRAWVEYHRKYAFPCACLVFGVLGLSLGVVPPRSGRGMGFTLAIVILCAYYLLFRVGENLGWKGLLHPLAAMWMPNFVFLGVAIYSLWSKSQERPVWIVEQATAGAAKLASLFRRKTRAASGKDE